MVDRGFPHSYGGAASPRSERDGGRDRSPAGPGGSRQGEPGERRVEAWRGERAGRDRMRGRAVRCVGPCISLAYKTPADVHATALRLAQTWCVPTPAERKSAEELQRRSRSFTLARRPRRYPNPSSNRYAHRVRLSPGAALTSGFQLARPGRMFIPVGESSQGMSDPSSPRSSHPLPHRHLADRQVRERQGHEAEAVRRDGRTRPPILRSRR